jgi:hypothetical protein
VNWPFTVEEFFERIGPSATFKGMAQFTVLMTGQFRRPNAATLFRATGLHWIGIGGRGWCGTGDRIQWNMHWEMAARRALRWAICCLMASPAMGLITAIDSVEKWGVKIGSVIGGVE